LNVHDHDPIAVIMSGRGENLIASTQHVLTHDLGRNVCVAGLGQITVGGAPYEATIALWVEPTSRFTIGYYRCDRCARSLLFSSASPSPSTTAATRSVRLPLSAASTLVAGSTSVMSVIALARVSLLLLVSFAGLATAPAAAPAAARRLRIVLRLWGAACSARSVWL
jgi:hypothetical protein